MALSAAQPHRGPLLAFRGIGFEGALNCRDAAEVVVRPDELGEGLVLALKMHDVGGLEEGCGIGWDVEAHARNLRRGPEVQCRAHCCSGRHEERPRHDCAQRRDRLTLCLLAGHDRVGPGRLMRW